MCARKPTLWKTVYSLKDGIETRFDSIADAAKQLNLLAPIISQVANGKYVHSGGYKFRFENGIFNDKPIMTLTEQYAMARSKMMQKSKERHAQPTRYCKLCNQWKNKKHFRKTCFVKCKECTLREKGIKNVGQHQEGIDLFNQGKWKCCTCQNIKPLSDFCKNRSYWTGYNANCKACMTILHLKHWKECRDKLSNSYVNTWINVNYNIPAALITEELRQTARLTIQAKRELKRMFSLDGMKFSKAELGRYIELKHNINHSTVERRVEAGATEIQCTIPEDKYRRLMQIKNSRIKPVITINVVTSERKEFPNLKVASKALRIGLTHMRECILNNTPTRLYKTSKTNQTYHLHYGQKPATVPG